jgi:hypothetical protein
MTSLVVLPAWFAGFLFFQMGVFQDWREAALTASVIWGVIVLGLTETFSLFHVLAFIPLLIAWGTISCISIWISIRVLRSRSLPKIQVPKPLRLEHFFSAALLAGVFIIFLATLVVALIAPPNSWDSMVYHMTRVAHWVDHRSIQCYPTQNFRELFYGPWAEFAVTHLQILVGSDRLANLVQFASMIGSVIGVSLVAKKLQADKYGQLFAAVFVATIPMGVLEASGNLNDYVTAFWFLCFLNYLIDLLDGSSVTLWQNAALCGASLGLAILTKMTAVIFAAPFILLAGIVSLKRRAAIYALVISGCTALVINAGHFGRNTSAFGRPLGPPVIVASIRNELHTPAAVTSNVIRNLAVHMAVPKIGRQINTMILKVHSLTGLDINDPRNSWLGLPYQYSFNFNELYTGAPFHLAVACLAIVFVVWRFSRDRFAAIYALCLVASFLLFCGYVRWMPWAGRYQLPLFVAIGPVCGLVLSRPSLRQVGYILNTFALCIGLLYSAKNDTRLLLGSSNIFVSSRLDLYFTSRTSLRDPYLAAADEVSRHNPAAIGVITGWDDWEYPFWLLVRMKLGAHTRFEHISVHNDTRNCSSLAMLANGLPDTIVIIGSPTPERIAMPVGYDPAPKSAPAGYKPVFVSDPIRVFEKENNVPVTQHN